MEHVKHRVLICSHNPEFLLPYKPQLEKDFFIQMAASEDIAQFIAKDWKAQMVLVDGDSLGNLTAQIRQSLGFINLGIIVLTQGEGGFKEEYAFRTGADHFISKLHDYKTLVWRMISLFRRMNNLQLPGYEKNGFKEKING